MFVPDLKEIPPRGVTEISSSQERDGRTNRKNTMLPSRITKQKPFNKGHEGKQQLNSM